MQHLARLLRAELVAAKGEVVGALWSLATQETCATAIVQEDKLVGCAPSTDIPNSEPCSTGPRPRHAIGPQQYLPLHTDSPAAKRSTLRIGNSYHR